MSTDQLFIGRLPRSTRSRELEDIFYKYGRMTRCDVKQGLKMSYGFIEYEDMRDAEDAIHHEHGREMGGSRIVVEWARGPKYDYRQDYERHRKERESRGGRFDDNRPSRDRRHSRSRSRDRKRRSRSRSRDRQRSRSRSHDRRRPRSRSRDRQRMRSRSRSRGRGQGRGGRSRSMSPKRRQSRSEDEERMTRDGSRNRDSRSRSGSRDGEIAPSESPRNDARGSSRRDSRSESPADRQKEGGDLSMENGRGVTVGED